MGVAFCDSEACQYIKNNVVQKYVFYMRKFFYEKMSLKIPETVRKCSENLQPQMSELQFLKTLIFAKAM